MKQFKITIGAASNMQRVNHLLLLLLCLSVTACTHHHRHPLALTSEDLVPTKTPFDSDGLARATYRMTYASGYDETIALLARMKYFPAGSLAPAERSGYVDGVAAAFDAWLQYSKSNVVKARDK